MADETAVAPEPSAVETMGLQGPRLAARVRQALYHVPAPELAHAHARIRDGSVARNLDYFHDGARETIRVLPCPIAMLPEEIAYLHGVTRTLHQALLRIPELYLNDPQVRDLLQLTPDEDRWLRECWTPAHRERNLSSTGSMPGRFHWPGVEGNPCSWSPTSPAGGFHLVPSVEEVVDEVMVPDPRPGSGDPLHRLPERASCSSTSWPGTCRDRRPGGCICMVEPARVGGSTSSAAWSSGISAATASTCSMPTRRAPAVGTSVLRGPAGGPGSTATTACSISSTSRPKVSVEPMRRLFRENRVMSSIGAELDHKACWEIFTDPELCARYYSEEERRVLQRHVLWTRVLADRYTLLPSGAEGDLLEYARLERETLVLKPSRGYGGEGVLLGQTATQGEWEAALETALADEELWFLQRLGQIPVLEVPHLPRRRAGAGNLLPRHGFRLRPRRARGSGARVPAAGGERGAAWRHVRRDGSRRVIDKSTSVIADKNRWRCGFDFPA
jgi:hypothetical protein